MKESKVKMQEVVMQIIEQISDAAYDSELKTKIKALIRPDGITSNPREETDGNRDFLRAMLIAILGAAEDLYGQGEDAEIYYLPIFKDQPSSQITVGLDAPDHVFMIIGTHANTWEEVFYDIAHESIHLLNPVANAQKKEVIVSAMEEGCAVKFAEYMYEKYIEPFCKEKPVTSPNHPGGGQYFTAYLAARKIPDDVLKAIREKFGRFSDVDDKEKLKELAASYINDEDIKILVGRFYYMPPSFSLNEKACQIVRR